jgi:tripartite-type tricarboxylate transporter receptor subunit TctC
VAVDTSWQQFRGVITPAGTPMAVQQALCAAVEKVMARPDMQAYVAESDLVPGYMAPAQFRSFVEAQNKTMVTWTEKLAAQK